jgi:hypothetical protein
MTFTEMTLEAARAAGMSPGAYREMIRALRAGDAFAYLDRDPMAGVARTETEQNEGNYKRPRKPVPEAEHLTTEERLAKVALWLSDLGRKVEVADITHLNKRAAQDWARRYTGRFAFVHEVAGKRLSDPMAKGILNCWRAEILHPEPQTERPAPTSANVEAPAELAEMLP